MRARFNVEFSETALGHVSQGNLKKMCRLGGLGGVFKYFLFSTLPGEMIHFDEHIFQLGWFNHQLDEFLWKKSQISPSLWAIYNDLSRRLVTPNGGEK